MGNANTAAARAATTRKAVALLRQQADACATNCVRAVLRGDQERALAYAKQHERFLARAGELLRTTETNQP